MSERSFYLRISPRQTTQNTWIFVVNGLRSTVRTVLWRYYLSVQKITIRTLWPRIFLVLFTASTPVSSLCRRLNWLLRMIWSYGVLFFIFWWVGQSCDSSVRKIHIWVRFPLSRRKSTAMCHNSIFISPWGLAVYIWRAEEGCQRALCSQQGQIHKM